MKEENEKVIVDETFVLKFEDSTQPAKRIKLEPTDPEAKESKVFVDAITQTEALDADPKVEIATQTEALDADPKVEIATKTAAAQKMRESYVPKKKKNRSEHVKKLERIRSKRHYEKKKKARNYFCHQCPHKSASEKAFETHYLKVHNVSQSVLKTDAWKEHLSGTPKE